jgi:hypothetical protein
MNFYHKKTHKDKIWSATEKEKSIQQDVIKLLVDSGYKSQNTNVNCNLNLPNIFQQHNKRVAYRLVDSILLNHPEVCNWSNNDIIITDAVINLDIEAKILNLAPEFWHIWHVDYNYQSKTPSKKFNCFMNRVAGDRSIVFYELIKRNLLSQGIVSYNCFKPGDNRNSDDQLDHAQKNLDSTYHDCDLSDYWQEHQLAQSIVPYNTVENHGALEDCILDSMISVVIETYISDHEIVFSEKLFRVLQLPRPWVLICSPGSVESLKKHGFDVLDDLVDHSYDTIVNLQDRIAKTLETLEKFVATTTFDSVLESRCQQAADHNTKLLHQWQQSWNKKFQTIQEQL